MDFSVILNQMGILVFIMAVGFVCAKLGATGREFTHSVAGVAINVLMVFTIISSVLNSQISISVGELARIAGLMFLLLGVSCTFGLIAPRLMGVDDGHYGISFLSIAFMNTVFVGYPVVESLYGAEGVFYASLSNIPFNIMLYSLGTGILSGRGREAVSFKNMMSPPMVATLIAIVIMLTGVRVPAVISSACATVGKATVPMSMLVIGTSLGLAPFREVLKDWRVYVIALVRQVLCPIAVWAIARMLVSDPVLLGVMVILASTPVGMVITALTIQYGKDDAYASRCVFVSTLFSAVTMPLLIYILL